jgi:hypothetical protein
MNYSICLDPTTVNNFNVANLSPNGFSIYTNLDFTTPLQTGITYDQLFLSPLGTCPYIIDLPLGVTQIIVVDNCIQPPVSSDLSGNAVIANCCYAILDIPQEPVPWCEECNLSFNVFNTSSIGQIIAGTLSSTCGTVTDYTIGWYRDGDYSSPEFISGFGNAFLPYDNLHPLTGQQAVPCLAGDWEGIIHDIAINGITYSSIAGTANGVPIPFESCFDTVVVNPLTCANGPYSGSSKYSHHIEFDSQAVGTTSSPVALTYVLDASTKYFAYYFNVFSISDEIEIKWISGDPSVTSNPSLYSQPIYLEKLINSENPSYSNSLPYPNIWPYNNYNYIPKIITNVWPKKSGNRTINRVLTLTSLETSSNPALPDHLEITITPNETSNNTAWHAGFQCLTNFDCTDCHFENWPNNLPKIKKIKLEKIYGCDSQKIIIDLTSSCLGVNSDFIYYSNDNDGYPYSAQPYQTNSGSLIDPLTNGNELKIYFPGDNSPSYTTTLEDSTTCLSGNSLSLTCAPPSTGTITLNKSLGVINLTFNLESDYLHYKNSLISRFIQASGIYGTSPLPCSQFNMGYFFTFNLTIPIQTGPAVNCGDNTIWHLYQFSWNDYFNIQYVESLNNFSITIPQTPIVNCYPPLECDNCFSIINSSISYYNSIQPLNPTTYTFTTTVGAKYDDPFAGGVEISRNTQGAASGSVCLNPIYKKQSYSEYTTKTMPFISSSTSTTGWVNLTHLSSSIPCNFTPYSPVYKFNYYSSFEASIVGLQVRYPHLTSSFNYAFGPGNSYSTNDFEIYALLNPQITGSLVTLSNTWPPDCPESSGSLIYRYSGSIATMYSSSYFFGGVAPTLVIDP